MSSYNGRRGPPASQFLRELNTLQPETNAEENFGLEDDLAMFTGGQFFDFDLGTTTDYTVQPPKPESEQTTTASPEDLNSATSPMGEIPSMDFIPADFNFPDFTAYQPNTISSYPENLPLQPLQPTAPVFPQPVASQAPYGQAAPRIDEKRKSESMASVSRQLNLEEQSRMAAEEDKRRRNTAASARFRVKKKQREQALEKSAKEMSDKVAAMEGRIQQLETENKWLKNMILEKNGGNDQVAKILEKGLCRKKVSADLEKAASTTEGAPKDKATS